MAMLPERSKPLHNFSMPRLKWGNQRVLRCVNLTNRRSKKNPIENQFHNSKRRKPLLLSNHIDDNLININTVREKLMVDLRVAAHNLKVSIFEERVAADDNSAANPRPWNLRTRRAACKSPNRDEQRNLDSPKKLNEAVVSKEKKENPETMEKNQKMMMINGRRVFSVSLSREEVEQDFWALVGTKPPRRPKKRPRIVQRQLDTLFPGLWLTEVNADSYKVPDDPE